MIVIVYGLPGSGKSYFASRLASLIEADYINSDGLRKELLVKRTYSENEKLTVYDEMLVRMKEALKQNKNLVLDATFYLNSFKELFSREAKRFGSISFIEVTADEVVIRERISKPRSESEADFEVYKKIQQQWEPLNLPHLVLKSTNDNIDDMLSRAINHLRLKDDKSTNK